MKTSENLYRKETKNRFRHTIRQRKRVVALFVWKIKTSTRIYIHIRFTCRKHSRNINFVILYPPSAFVVRILQFRIPFALSFLLFYIFFPSSRNPRPLHPFIPLAKQPSEKKNIIIYLPALIYTTQ